MLYSSHTSPYGIRSMREINTDTDTDTGTDTDVERVIQILKKRYRAGSSLLMAPATRGDPFLTLISCLLSLRTRDEVTSKAAERLFSLAKTPEAMLKLRIDDIESAIYPVGFYHRKAKQIVEICSTLVERYNSKVPDELDELLKLRGVGRKTANIVLTIGYNKPGIAVDTHVHRISNRMGIVATKNPNETEFALRRVVPEQNWLILNELFVLHGRSVCTPLSPRCSICPVYQYCKRVGVTRSR